MTSSNITIGHVGEPRNSSRVLKPPGGGHSDIFGIYDDNKTKSTPAKRVGPKSTIQEVFCMDTTEKTEKNTETKDELIEKHNVENGDKENGEKEINAKENGEKENKQEKENGEEKQNGKVEAPKPQIPVTPQRVRVPPGGFSSGLW